MARTSVSALPVIPVEVGLTFTADLSAYTGDVLLGFRYWTDAAEVHPGFMVDNLEITGYPR